MAEFVVMPRMNLTMEEGLLAKWYKSIGDNIEVDEPIFSIESDKAIEDVLSMVSGTVLIIMGEEGGQYPVATPLAIVGKPGENYSSLLAEASKIKKHDFPELKTENVISSTERLEDKKTGVKMLPKVRKLIREKDIDLNDLIIFSGNKKITEDDVNSYEKANAQKDVTSITQSKNDRVARMSNMRKAIAKKMIESCTHTARLTNFMEVDITAALKAVSALKTNDRNISITALIIKACAIALRQHEIINSTLDEVKDEIIFRGDVNISCAMDMQKGLVVPVIRNADLKDVWEITAEVVSFAAKAQENKLTNEEMRDGTFTVSNVGMLDVTFFTPIINYPQTAILGIGSIITQPRYTDDTCTVIVPKNIMTIGLTYDHRVIDGAPASRFLQTVRDTLQTLDALL